MRTNDACRTYEEAIGRTVERLIDSALIRESCGLDPETNTLYFTNSLSCSQELIGFVYRIDLDTVIDDFKEAVGSYGGKVPHLKMPSFIEGGDPDGD